jgi:Fe-S cluster biogenesis protein NfuA
MADASNPRAAADRIHELVQELEALADSCARSKAEELVQLLLQLYGAGICRILEIVDGEEAVAERLLRRFAADDLVGSLLLLHNLHPLDAETRIARALDSVRSRLAGHGGSIEVAGFSDGVLRLRLERTSNGCYSSAALMKPAIERAIESAAPEVSRIEIEGLDDSEQPARLVQIAMPPPASKNNGQAAQGCPSCGGRYAGGLCLEPLALAGEGAKVKIPAPGSRPELEKG